MASDSKYGRLEYIEDMIQSCEEILEDTKELDIKDFLADANRSIYKATLTDIRIIGRSAYHLLPYGIFDLYHPEIPWRQLIATSYVLEQSTLNWSIHGTVIWSIVQETIPKLLPILKAMKTTMDKTKESEYVLEQQAWGA